jgi:hypothetical protein
MSLRSRADSAHERVEKDTARLAEMVERLDPTFYEDYFLLSEPPNAGFANAGQPEACAWMRQWERSVRASQRLLDLDRLSDTPPIDYVNAAELAAEMLKVALRLAGALDTGLVQRLCKTANSAMNRLLTRLNSCYRLVAIFLIEGILQTCATPLSVEVCEGLVAALADAAPTELKAAGANAVAVEGFFPPHRVEEARACASRITQLSRAFAKVHKWTAYYYSSDHADYRDWAAQTPGQHLARHCVVLDFETGAGCARTTTAAPITVAEYGNYDTFCWQWQHWMAEAEAEAEAESESASASLGRGRRLRFAAIAPDFTKPIIQID